MIHLIATDGSIRCGKEAVLGTDDVRLVDCEECLHEHQWDAVLLRLKEAK